MERARRPPAAKMTSVVKMTEIIAIIGPTASGKSAVAALVAEKIGGEILAVDSMTIYRGLDIGTAKPTPAERAAVRHHLLDIAEPTEKFTVAEFVGRADAVIASARVPLIATGGTPMYFKALFEGLFEGPAADLTVRARLEAEDPAMLHRRLRSIDPAAADRIHVNDTRRLTRALEVYELTGSSISSLQRQWSSGTPRHPARWFGLNWDNEALNRRINVRVKQMIAAGWLDEMRDLLARHVGLSLTAGQATGYAELTAHLQGSMSLDDAVEQIKIATRQLARRQMKWFRRFPNVTWLDGVRDTAALKDEIMAAVRA